MTKLIYAVFGGYKNSFCQNDGYFTALYLEHLYFIFGDMGKKLYFFANNQLARVYIYFQLLTKIRFGTKSHVAAPFTKIDKELVLKAEHVSQFKVVV